MIGSTLVRVIADYPEGLRASQLADIQRQVFHVETVLRLAPGGRMVDIGGGVGMFSVTCAALGLDVSLVDDWRDGVNVEWGDEAFIAHKRHGVNVVQRDVIAEGLDFPPHSIDLVTCFESMEHWHGSPKSLFAQVVEILRPGGWFFLGVPNAVNLRKRIGVPLGNAKWSQMSDWYEQPVFRGHVREPDVADLLYIARDMRLEDVSITGRNWLGLYNPNPKVVKATRLIDTLLRRFPSLCSDIYLTGRTPG